MTKGLPCNAVLCVLCNWHNEAFVFCFTVHVINIPIIAVGHYNIPVMAVEHYSSKYTHLWFITNNDFCLKCLKYWSTAVHVCTKLLVSRSWLSSSVLVSDLPHLFCMKLSILLLQLDKSSGESYSCVYFFALPCDCQWSRGIRSNPSNPPWLWAWYITSTHMYTVTHS